MAILNKSEEKRRSNAILNKKPFFNRSLSLFQLKSKLKYLFITINNERLSKFFSKFRTAGHFLFLIFKISKFSPNLSVLL